MADIKVDRIVTPSMEYFLKVEYDSKIKEVSWDGNSLFEDENIENRLQEITQSILDTIESKDDYKKLPTPREHIYNLINSGSCGMISLFGMKKSATDDFSYTYTFFYSLGIVTK